MPGQLIFVNEDLVVVMLHHNDQDFILVSMYCSPGKNIDNSLELLKPHLLKYYNFPFLIFGDFNAKSRLWGQRDLDERGSKLLHFCHSMDLNVENDPFSPPTFSSSRGDSWIDLLLTKNLSDEISLEVRDEITNSDHNMLFVNFLTANHSINHRNKIFLKNLNWWKLKANIHSIINSNLEIDQLSNSDINSFISNIQDQIFAAASSKPSTNHHKKQKYAIWWTRELQSKRSFTRALRRLFQKEIDPQLREIKKLNYKKHQALYKKLIITTKRTKFKDFINSISSKSLFGNNYNIFSNKKKRNVVSKRIINSSGTLSTTIADSKLAILDFHFPWSNRLLTDLDLHSQTDFIPFTCHELEAIVNKIKPNEAVGVDGLPGEVIREIFIANKVWFKDLFNLLLGRGIFPDTWKTARIALIEKEKRELNHAAHFRPICILPCWGKILDKAIAERLTFHLEQGNILHDSQFGFRRNRSTITAIHNVLEHHKAAEENKQMTCLISLDMSNAFNSVDWDILLKKIFSLNIPYYLKRIIHSFLEARQAQLDGHIKNYNNGIPQGSSLGPILWNIYINDLLETNFGPHTKVQAFADDILIMLTAPASYHFTIRSQDVINIIQNWTRLNLMTVNQQKSFFTILSSRKFTHIPSIKSASSPGRHPAPGYQTQAIQGSLPLKHMGNNLVILNQVLQPLALDTTTKFIPPWEKYSIKWNFYTEDLTGTLIFTDGSKMNGRVGGAFVVYSNGIETHCEMFRLSDHATVYSAELLAITQAINFAINARLPSANIISDSRSVLQALENVNHVEKEILAIKQLLANQESAIRLFWIKAHAGFTGNERADEYAKNATTKEDTDFTMGYSIPYIKGLIKKDLLKQWQDRWSSSTKGRELFSILPEVKTSRIQGDFFTNQLLTGHGCIGIYQERFFGKSAVCSCGQLPEDRNHIIYDCPQWDAIRQRFFPKNYLSVQLDLLLFNKISRTGLRELMNTKLQASLQFNID
ncbi:uncharacterized protein CDAR_443101 [Caerostris darwini]|uniref:Uncharacterized protein n=1 Tax=Caerostris darwini TaxID=1538125 RepID=A0AAV4MVV3_9ARAC|nr:uncharacterized protein CDAR_443101 [Caerostris darwini]